MKIVIQVILNVGVLKKIEERFNFWIFPETLKLLALGTVLISAILRFETTFLVETMH